MNASSEVSEPGEEPIAPLRHTEPPSEPKRPVGRPRGSQTRVLNQDGERAPNRAPVIEDRLDLWLTSSLALALNSAGIVLVRDIVNFANSYGYRWHRFIPGLGERRAQRLIEWVQPIAREQGHELVQGAFVRATDLAALGRRERERLEFQSLDNNKAGSVTLVLDQGLSAGDLNALPPEITDETAPSSEARALPLQDTTTPTLLWAAHSRPPPELSGERGTFRAPNPNIWGVNTDADAILQWLNGYQGKTKHDYSRVVDRFYRWCIHVRGRPVSSLVEEDILAYQAFISDPPSAWVQHRSVARDHPDARPFRHALSANSQSREFSILGSLFTAMMDRGYLRANVMKRMPRALRLIKPSINTTRSFDERQYAYMMKVLDSLPQSPFRTRLELVLELGTTTGLRLSELTTARMKGMRLQRGTDVSVWLLDIVGKGGRERTVVVFDHVKRLLEKHHADMEKCGTAFRPEVSRVQMPPAPKTAAGLTISGAYEIGPVRGGAYAVSSVQPQSPTTATMNSPATPDPPAAPDLQPALDLVTARALEREMLERWRPLVGALREPPPRRKLDASGIAMKGPPSFKDRYGALDPSALYQSLRRFFRRVAEEAAKDPDGLPPSAFLKASTHWLRHTFAHEALDHLGIEKLQKVLGHADISTTGVYVRARMEDVVQGMQGFEASRRRKQG